MFSYSFCCVILRSPASLLMHQIALTESEELLADLVHDLRQPLDVIEGSASYLGLLLGGAGTSVHEQLRIIGNQVSLAAQILADAAARLAPTGIQCAGAAENLDLTKSQTAAVT